ncbi:MATE family efflux transporter, partial [Flavobacterium sp. IR1]
IFAAVTLLMSEFNTATIAAHQAAINFASFLYMIPLSFAFTLTIAVGYEVGAKRFDDAKQYSKMGIWMALGMGVIAGLIIYVMRGPVSGLYTNDPNVARLIQQFLIYSIFFQLSDALATPIQGVLRG